MKALWIVGGAGAALEVWAVHAALLAQRSAVPLAGFVTLEPTTEFDPRGHPVVLESGFALHADPASNAVVLALGNPSVRMRAAANFSRMGYGFATLVHPSAIVGPRVSLGAGSVVMAGAVLETDVQVGEHALINVHASIAHESRIGACCSLGPGARLAGRVTLGARCDLGVGAVVRPYVTLGDDVVAGAGAVIVKDCTGPATLVGVPARPLPTKRD